MSLTDGLMLYHGSYASVLSPDLKKCRSGKDFGRGFYVTTNRLQAEKFAKTSARKAISNRLIGADSAFAYINIFQYDRQSDPSVYEFKSADSEWLHCVVMHRREKVFQSEVDGWKHYDILCGKIANDNTNLVITAYMDGLYGQPMSPEADRIAIGFLEPENLKDQISFRTEKALLCLKHIESIEVPL